LKGEGGGKQKLEIEKQNIKNEQGWNKSTTHHIKGNFCGNKSNLLNQAFALHNSDALN